MELSPPVLLAAAALAAVLVGGVTARLVYQLLRTQREAAGGYTAPLTHLPPPPPQAYEEAAVNFLSHYEDRGVEDLAVPVDASGLAYPRGWYPDPAGSGDLRFFDGERWTRDLRPAR